MKIDMIVSVPLYVWLVCAVLLAAIAFFGGWKMHKNHLLAKNAPKKEKKPKKQPAPDGWDCWEI